MPTATITFGTFASDNANGGSSAWSNGSNAASSNNTYATSDVLPVAESERFKFTNGSGGTLIDDAATITAVRLFCECSVGTGGVTIDVTEAFLVKGGTTQTGATNKATGTISSTTDATKQFGSNDTFGVTLTGADVKASGFGGSLVVANNDPSELTYTVRFDYVYAEVDYTNPSNGGPLIDRTRTRLLMSPRRVP